MSGQSTVWKDKHQTLHTSFHHRLVGSLRRRVHDLLPGTGRGAAVAGAIALDGDGHHHEAVAHRGAHGLEVDGVERVRARRKESGGKEQEKSAEGGQSRSAGEEATGGESKQNQHVGTVASRGRLFL